MRGAEVGHRHDIAGAYLLPYAQEASWREDKRRLSNDERVNRVAGLAPASRPSVDLAGIGRGIYDNSQIAIYSLCFWSESPLLWVGVGERANELTERDRRQS